jgi:CDP-glycerol glycerophosphotransferase
MVLLEALCLGIPVVATDIPGNRSVLADAHGRLVPNSEDGLVQGMLDALTGKIPAKPFEAKAYNQEALAMFEREAVDLVDGVRPLANEKSARTVAE